MSKDLPNDQQLFSSKDGSQWIPSLDGKPSTDIDDWLHQNLTFDEREAIVNPPKTKPQLILDRRAKFQSDVNKLMQPATMAIILDGDLEAARKAAIKAQYVALESQLQLDIAAINSGD